MQWPLVRPSDEVMAGAALEMRNEVARAYPHRSYPETAKGIGNEAQSDDIVVYPSASISPRHHSPTARPGCATCLRGTDDP